MSMVTYSPNWPDDYFSSAEIEELNFLGKKTLEEVGEPIEITLYFSPEKAHEYLDAVTRIGYDPKAQHQLLSFCGYIGRGVAVKLDAVENGSD